jgi:hypothetical protein
MRQSEFDKITAALGRAEFAMEAVRIRADELRRKSALATTMEEIATLNIEAAELLNDLAKITLAVHTRIAVITGAGYPNTQFRLSGRGQDRCEHARKTSKQQDA